MPFLGQVLLLAAAPPILPAPATAPAAPLIFDQNRPDRMPAPALPPASASSASAPVTIEAGEADVVLRVIDFRGAVVPAPVATAARAFVGRPASRATLAAVAAAMAAAYARTDIALYTIAVPSQSLAGGRLTIVVAEGYVEQVQFVHRLSPLLKAYAMRLTVERPLRRRTLERYLSLMRDVPGATLDVQMLRGTRPGAVILRIDAKRKRHEFATGYDNRGTNLLGAGEGRAEAHFYGLLRDGDRTDLTGLVSPDLRRLRYVAASHTTPLGHDGATATASAGYISTHPRRGALDGTARTFGLTASLPLVRGFKRNLSLTLGLDGIDSDSAALGDLVSSDHTRAVRLATGWSDSEPKSALTAGVTLSRGLDILRARGTPGVTDTAFTKLNGRITYDHAFGQHWVARARAAGQWSPDRLAAAERFAIGGADFGRAFDTAVLSGDSGYAASAELALRPKLSARLAGSELYLFADRATVHIAARGIYAAGDFDLASAGGGVRIAYTPRATIELEAARAVDEPYPGYRQKWRINIGWRLTLARR